ncbi:berberine bridge enzyme-like 21 isoform X2 [Tripterygium wilfordii]|uniref:berberine bridge enzyme-like 21 isoform X2 n=1 Tax=Tripterygium wilfordii TaxID=458696 RepID=UPI0018F81B75|nr:berberine bridge enzyme-like 21 isoform X2 [Tripterygium wilfordii]
METKTPTMFIFLLLFILNLSSSICEASDDNSVHTMFLDCLSKETNQQISNIVYSQSNPSYTSILRAYIRNARFNTSSTLKPTIIVTPESESHVQATVVCAKKLGFQLKIRSGGHDYEGISYVSDTPFLILDMFNLRTITVDVENQSAFVQSGATLGELYYKIWEKSKVLGFPAGVCPTVGVGGHFSGGGYGNMLRKFGLSVDHIFDAQIVDVNGRILDRKSMGEDLFWAIKGGGGASFGVVLSYSINLVPVPEKVTVFRIEKTIEENATDLVYKWQSVAPTIDNDLFLRLLLQPVTSKINKGQKTVRASVIAMYLGNAEAIVGLLGKEFPEMGLKIEDCIETTWIDSMVWWANYDNGTSPTVLLDRNPDSANFLKRKSDYVQTPISKQSLEWIWKKMIEQGKVGFVFNSYGGRMSEIPETETPFPHRKGNLFKIQYSVNWQEEGADALKNYLNQAKMLYSYMTPFVSKNPRSAYLNYRDLDIGVMPKGGNDINAGRVYGEKYFGVNFDRLVKVKSDVDPQNFFRNEQSIPTLPKIPYSGATSGKWVPVLSAIKLMGPLIWLLGLG